MKAWLVSVVLLGTLILPAIAEVTSNLPPAAETEMITPNQAKELAQALTVITGSRPQMVGQGSSQKEIPVPYEIESGPWWALEDDIQILKDFLQKAQQKLDQLRQQAEAENGGPLSAWKREPVTNANGVVTVQGEPSDAAIKLDQAAAVFMNTPVSINKLFRIHRADLKQDKNHFDGTTISAINLILLP